MANNTNPFAKIPPGLLLVAGLVLTAAIILAIKFMVRDEEQPASAPAAGTDTLFKGEEKSTPPGLNPAYRSETTSGDSLDIFTKTNKGYAEEESSAAAVVPAATAAVAKTTAPAAAAQKKPRAVPGTVIPRMTQKSFGARPQQQGGTPDIQSLLKEAQKKTGGQ